MPDVATGRHERPPPDISLCATADATRVTSDGSPRNRLVRWLATFTSCNTSARGCSARRRGDAAALAWHVSYFFGSVSRPLRTGMVNDSCDRAPGGGSCSSLGVGGRARERTRFMRSAMVLLCVCVKNHDQGCASSWVVPSTRHPPGNSDFSLTLHYHGTWRPRSPRDGHDVGCL